MYRHKKSSRQKGAEIGRHPRGDCVVVSGRAATYQDTGERPSVYGTESWVQEADTFTALIHSLLHLRKLPSSSPDLGLETRVIEPGSDTRKSERNEKQKINKGGEEVGDHLEDEGHAVCVEAHDESLPAGRLFLCFLIYLCQH